jgi:hypothetical protein
MWTDPGSDTPERPLLGVSTGSERAARPDYATSGDVRDPVADHLVEADGIEARCAWEQASREEAGATRAACTAREKRRSTAGQESRSWARQWM